MTSPIQTILAVAGIGGRLAQAGDKLRMFLPPDTDPELKASIRANKLALLALVEGEGRGWRLIRSDALDGAFVFLAADEAVKAKLVGCGAHPEAVYTRAELAELVRAGVEPGQLLAIHRAKDVFRGRITAAAS